MSLAIPADDLLRWNDITATRFRELLLANQHLLTVPTDVRSSGDVAHLLQHIVAVHLTPADLRAHPAHRADERAPAPHRRVHSDVLVFAQPHSSGSSGEPKGLQEEPEGGVGVPEGSGAGVPGDPGAAGSGGSVSSSRAERA